MQLITILLHLMCKGSLRSSELRSNRAVWLAIFKHMKNEVRFLGRVHADAEWVGLEGFCLQWHQQSVEQCRGDAVKHRISITTFVFCFMIERQHVPRAMKLTGKAITIAEPELVFRATALSVCLCTMSESVVIAGLFKIKFFRDLHPFFGVLQINTVVFTLIYILWHIKIFSLLIRDGDSLLLPAKGHSGTTVRRNRHLMCATSLSSCQKRNIWLCGHLSTGKMSAQTAEVM